MSEEINESVEAAPSSDRPKKSAIPNEKIAELTAGIPQYDKASFLVVGHRNGVRVALPKTNGVSRAYFYGNGDYSLVPSHAAITVFTDEQRKERRLGGIMAEVVFDQGLDAAVDALGLLIEAVRSAPAPTPKGAKAPKKPRKAKGVPSDESAGGAPTETTESPEAPAE